MSLINKMLLELDKRHAPHGVGDQPAAQKLAAGLRPAAGGRVGSDMFWWAMAIVMLLLIAWLGWVIWQLTPRPVVTDLAYQHRQRMEAVGLRPGPANPAVEQVAEQASPSGESAGAGARAVSTNSATASATPGVESPPQIDMLKLATSIDAPILPRREARAAAPVSETTRSTQPRSVAGKSDGGTIKPEPARPESSKPAAATAPVVAGAPPARADEPKPAPPPAARAPQIVASVDSGRIDKRVTSTPAERAESEYRRAIAFVNQGRVSEGLEGLRSALSIDAAHDGARQTLVSLLAEQRRFDEAFSAAQQGLEINPGNSGYAMLTARIMVERKDLKGALAVLQKHAPSAGSNAEYHAFTGALYQRLGRHAEAVDEYQTALRLSPQTGAWWVGLGISQEASERRKEAVISFKRAQSAGNLNPELVTFIDQRLRQLQ